MWLFRCWCTQATSMIHGACRSLSLSIQTTALCWSEAFYGRFACWQNREQTLMISYYIYIYLYIYISIYLNIYIQYTHMYIYMYISIYIVFFFLVLQWDLCIQMMICCWGHFQTKMAQLDWEKGTCVWSLGIHVCRQSTCFMIYIYIQYNGDSDLVRHLVRISFGSTLCCSFFSWFSNHS